MKLRRGCGCPVLILCALNLLMVASLILGFIQGNSSGVLSVFMLIMFLANVVILAMVGWSALRSKDGGAAEGGDESESAAAEGEEAQETDEGIEAEE